VECNGKGTNDRCIGGSWLGVGLGNKLRVKVMEERAMSDARKIAKIEVVKGLFEKPLKIPDYQRPYKWSQKHALQLVDDLIFHQDKGRYRIGTVVLHEDNDGLNIVDGQQRVVTLCLILHALGETKVNPLLKEPEQEDKEVFNTQLMESSISRKTIQNNYAAIKQRLVGLSDNEKERLKDFILNNCEIVKVVLEDLSEAFQFFDSQNARGKSLEPYDLLKAFHLREMDSTQEDEKKACVVKWEAAIQSGELKPLFNEYLYRIREWVRGNSAFYFTKENVDIFKGVSFQGEGEKDYPYVQTLKLTDKYINQLFMNSIKTYPFQIDQVMINGKRFFEYVEYYRKQLHSLKNTEHEVFKIINNYTGMNRTGDAYTRNLFQASLLYYVDKFGDEYLDQAVNTAFFWAYSIRLENTAVRLATMDNKGREHQSMFRVVAHAVHPKEVLSFPFHKANNGTVFKTDGKWKATKVDRIIAKFGINKKEVNNENSI